MIRVCCGQSHLGPVCPDGLVMCQLCFRRFLVAGLHVGEDGVTWDVCRGCAHAKTPAVPATGSPDA